MGDVIHLAQFRHRKNSNVVFLGDFVEWKDEHGDKNISQVKAIYYRQDQYTALLKVAHFHLEVSQHYVLDIPEGQISAHTVCRKIFKKA